MRGWASMQGDETYLCGDMQVGVNVMNVMSASGHVSVLVGIHVSMRVGIHVSVRVGMCPCEWACVHASEMGRCDNHEGVGIHVGGQDISVWGNAGGHRCNEGEGECIHVGGSRWHPCENMQVGMDVMSTRGHMAMQVGQGGTHAGTCRPAAGGNPWMWVGCVLSMVGVNTVRCCYI